MSYVVEGFHQRHENRLYKQLIFPFFLILTFDEKEVAVLLWVIFCFIISSKIDQLYF